MLCCCCCHGPPRMCFGPPKRSRMVAERPSFLGGENVKKVAFSWITCLKPHMVRRQKIGLSMVCGYMTKLAQQTIIPLRLYLFGAMLLRQSASSNTAGPAGRSQDPCGMLKGLNAQLRFRSSGLDDTVSELIKFTCRWPPTQYAALLA